MSAGLGILFGSVFLGFILLYLGTKGTWNWQKIVRRSVIVIGVLVALAVLAIIGLFANDKWQQRPKVVTSLEGVALGEKFSDVVFRHGSFEKIPVKKDVRRKYEDEEEYVQREKRLQVSVRNRIVSGISYL